MANLLKMANVQSILLLHAQGWPQRRIARELGIDRGTVGKYLRQQLCGAKPANVPTGSEDPKPANLPMVPALGPKPAEVPIGWIAESAASKPANAPTGSAFPAGPRSKCEPHREMILAKMQEGPTAQRIYQDLGGAEAGLGYDSVRRFLRRLGGKRVLPFRRTECQAGEEGQVDFGAGARVQTSDGRWRKTNVFRIVLSHSRKAYSEASYTQTTEDFLRCLENAFAHFGGVPAALVIDNLKAAVAHHVAVRERVATLFISLEMSQMELAERLVSSASLVPLEVLKNGDLSAEQRRANIEAVAELSQGRLWIDDSASRSMLEIAAQARRLKKRHGLGLLVIDYLQLIEPDNSRDPREQQVARISRKLKGLARELNIPVVCLAQLNRQTEAGDHKPRLGHLRESGAIEQDADVVLFIYREDYYLSPQEAQAKNVAGVAEIIVAKQRNGGTGCAKLLWQPSIVRFVSIATPQQAGQEWSAADYR